MEPLRTLESPGVRPWDRPLSSAPASFSRASSSADLTPASTGITTSLEEESAGHVASRSSLGTSINSTSSSASSTRSAQSVAYHGIDVETVSAVPGSLSYDKCTPFLRSRMLNLMMILLLVHLLVNTGNPLSIVPQS